MSFARYQNRAEVQAQTFKYDASAYKFTPNLIYKIDPAPVYPERASIPKKRDQMRAVNLKHYYEKFRNNDINKERLRDRYMTGRLYSHFKQEEMKQHVQEINDKENDIHSKLQYEKNLYKDRGMEAPDIEIDDEFKLPYGMGYDHVIKKKTDMVNK